MCGRYYVDDETAREIEKLIFADKCREKAGSFKGGRQYEDREHFVILTTPYDVTDVEMADRVFLVLSETVGNRLRADQVQIEVVSVGIKYAGTIISTVP